MSPKAPADLVASELGLPPARVGAVISLLNEGNTVPFIARYRKEVTGDMDEVQIRTIGERHTYLLELEERRTTILHSISEQGKLTPELEARIRAATTKTLLEDLYLPYKPKRRTRAIIARERGLQPLADLILTQVEGGDALAIAAAYIDVEKGVESAEAALAGARDIIAEQTSEDAEVRAWLRDVVSREGVLVSEADPEKTREPTKFQQYYNFSEKVATIPSHRFLAIRRGEHEEVLRVHIQVDDTSLLPRLLLKLNHNPRSGFGAQLQLACQDALKRLLLPSIQTEVLVDLKMKSDREAVEVFASNLKSILLAAPLGGRRVVGIDPGLRTGCKVVAVDDTGKFLENITLYLVQGDRAVDKSREDLLKFVKKHQPLAIAVGNGTGGRETEAFVKKLLTDEKLTHIITVAVNEAGASVYSASDVAREEFPDLDLTIRGSISIARRLQDPLAELVKVDPKSMGVGQYQHDVSQTLLGRKLDEVVESCVNHVGVELNTASAPLLGYVAGIGPSLAKKIVRHREEHGAFKGRHQLLEVAGLGPRTFEQAAGFLRVRGGTHPLDASAVHPERYSLVERMARDVGTELSALVGSVPLADKIQLARYVGGDVGEPTLRDIINELKKPGRDPRETFEPPRFREDVHTLEDLKVGMELEGIVTNVTAFGAFVDVGVHQDGLVHISQLAERFVKDPHEVVKSGDKIKVRVLEVDLALKRIALTARSDGGRPNPGNQGPGKNPANTPSRSQVDRPSRRAEDAFKNNPFAVLGNLKVNKTDKKS